MKTKAPPLTVLLTLLNEKAILSPNTITSMFKVNFSRFIIPAILVTAALYFPACKKDDSDTPTTASVEITDGPIDDTNVKAVFVTVADVKIDGKSWSGFKGKTTFDLSAYQNGQTKLLGDGELDAQSYDEITLVLDTETDASGNAPGCYVLDATNVKHKLEGGTSKEIKAKGSFVADATAKSTAVIDFDLRKSLTYSNSATTDYAFVTDAEISSALKLTTKGTTGTIKGTCTDAISDSEKIVVYAYEKGEFDLNTEKQGQGSSQIQFKNAVTSAVIGQNGSFQLSFLEKGDYELHFVSYTDANNDGKLEAKGELQVSLAGDFNLLNLILNAGGTVDLSLILVTGITLF